MEEFLTVALVGVFGGIGSLIRYFIGSWNGLIPWGILVTNCLGAGVAAMAVSAGEIQIALAVGLAGGLSTFSTFAGQTYDLLHSGKKFSAFLNAGFNLLLPAVVFLTVSLIF